MTTTIETPVLYEKETAVAIRRLLADTFPSTRFSVRTERGSMVSSVRVAWTDGPTSGLVDRVVSRFEAGHFDGTTDSYEYDRSRFVIIDGQAFRPGTKYVHTNRTIGLALARRAAAQVAEFYGIVMPDVVEWAPYTQGWKLSDNTPITFGKGYTEYPSTLIHQASRDRTRFAREG